MCFKESNLKWLNDIVGPDFVKESLSTGVISIPDKRRDYVESLMNKMIFENEGQDILSPAFIRTGLKLMQQIETYIYENYDKKLSLEDMSDKFHISRSYLSKKFKAVTGFGFKEYIVNVRIKNACRLLLETNKSITDIAFECGFNDSNYFGDAFRHVKGVSPNKYRKNKEAI